MDVAKRASENMSREIDDQLTQCSYPKHSRRAIDDLCKLGSGVMKGPLNGKAAQRWKKAAEVLGNGQRRRVYQLAPVVDGNSPDRAARRSVELLPRQQRDRHGIERERARAPPAEQARSFGAWASSSAST
jgi:hypothetical protein